MKKVSLMLFLLVVHHFLFSQTIIKMKSENGVSVIPCKVNGLKLNFIFDTGASDVSISTTEAWFMIKNDYLDTSDVIGTSDYQDANGIIREGVTINLKEIEIGNLRLYNVKATVVANIKAPLLLGQSAIGKLGKIEIDLASNTLTILNGQNYSNDSQLVDTTLIIKDTPSTENDYIEAIQSKIDRNDYGGIITDCNKVLELNPKNEKAYKYRGYAKAGLENYEDAIGDYNKAIEIDSTDAIAFCFRGVSKKFNTKVVKERIDRFFKSLKILESQKTN